jgi:hypothetical protein
MQKVDAGFSRKFRSKIFASITPDLTFAARPDEQFSYRKQSIPGRKP